MDFNLDRLRAFIIVARTGKLTAAAKEAGTTQPNLGRQMTALEKEVGLTLFVRHSRGLSLTKQGEEFLLACQDIVGQISQIADIIREKDSKPCGMLKVVTGIGTSEAILNKIHLFVKKFPNIQINLISHVNILSVNPFQFKIGDADIAILPTKLSDPDLIQHHLGDMALRIYAAPRYFKDNSMPKTLEDLKDHRMVVYTGDNKEIPMSLNIQLSENKIMDIYSKPIILVNNGINLRSSLINGLGIGTYFYDRELIEQKLLIDVFPNMPDHKTPYYFTYHRRLEGSPKVKAFHDFFQEVIKVWGRPDLPKNS